MNVKELFEKAENGSMTYEQFEAAAKEANAKFADLSEGNYVSKQKYSDELAARDTRITGLEGTLSTRDSDLANLQTQLANAGTDATKLGQLNEDLTKLQGQYDKDTKALQKQLKEQAYKFAVREYANNQNFTSNAAKRDFISSMLAKNLQMENDMIIGADDFVKLYSAENSDAFVVANPEPTPQPVPSEPVPHFVHPSTPDGSTPEPDNPFQFNFVGVRAH